jgi:hypothetical protein
MTTPREEQPQDQPAPEPRVSTAPPRSRWRSMPTHVGPARTSTVILAVLWLALGALYLNVRPPTPATAAATTGGTSVEAPARPTTTAPRTSSARPSTSTPTTRTEQTTGTSTSSASSSATSSPTETSIAPSGTSPSPGTFPAPTTTGTPPTS